jgi:hypothetical protein
LINFVIVPGERRYRHLAFLNRNVIPSKLQRQRMYQTSAAALGAHRFATAVSLRRVALASRDRRPASWLTDAATDRRYKNESMPRGVACRAAT